MKKENKNIYKKAGAIALGLGIVGASVFAGSKLFPETIVEELPVEKIVYQDVIVEVPTIVTETTIVEKEVLVDNGNLELVLKYVYDEGELEFLTEDLFEDELDLIVDRILLIEEVKSVSVDFALSNFARELEKQLDYDRRDVSKVKLVKDSVEFVKESADFKYGEFEVKLSVEFRYDSVVEEKEVLVEYYDGRVRNILID
jgi:hypothetical protein